MPRVQNPSIGAGAAPLLSILTQLSAAQIQGFPGTPVQLVPAPGAGKLIIVLGVAAVFTAGTVLYQSSGGDQTVIFYAGDTANPVCPKLNNVLSLGAIPTSAFTYASGIIQNGFAIVTAGHSNTAVQVTNAAQDQGQIATTSLGAGGAGYVANDTGTITTGNGDATYKVLTVGAGGAVLTYQITNQGSGYSTGNGQATAVGGAQPGVGVGLTINVLTINLGNGTLQITTYYQIVPSP